MRIRKRINCTKVGIYFVVLIFTFILAFPIFWVFTLSLKTQIDMFRIPPVWIPWPPCFENYVTAFQDRPLAAFIRNSLIVTGISTFLSVTIASLAGYGFARFSFKYKSSSMLGILASRMIPPVCLALPLFIIMNKMSLLDTYASLIISYTTFNLPFAIWVIHGYFIGIPPQLDEAAMVDGCSRLQAFVKVVLPVATPGLIAISVLCILLSWKDFFWALLFTYSPNSQTIPIGITTYMSAFHESWGQITAVGVLAILPVVIFALLVQNYLIEGLTRGALKG